VDAQEVYEHVVGALEREFTSGEFAEGEFRVVSNPVMHSVTIIENETSEAFMLMDVTGGTWTRGDIETEPVVVQIAPNWGRNDNHSVRV